MLSSVGVVLATVAVLSLIAGVGLRQAALDLGTRSDPLGFVVRALVWSTAWPTGVGLILGFVGWLHISVASLVLVAIIALQQGPLARQRVDLREHMAAVAAAIRPLSTKHPVVGGLALTALASEVVTGLSRPPLSWDALAYHLLLPATWLQRLQISVPFGRYPTSFYGLFPGNGEVWLWWWMSPSHSELFVNLASVPHWLLLVAATGLLARHLGAQSHWPLAAAVVGTLPFVVKAAATPYIDLYVAATLTAGLALWLDSGRRSWPSTAAALGLAAGAKVFALVFALSHALVIGFEWIYRRWPISRAVAFALLLAGLGAPFYLRNIGLGVGPVAQECVVLTEGSSVPLLLAGHQTVIGSLGARIADGSLLGTFLGNRRPASFELGIGPAAILVVLAFACLLRRATRPGWRLVAGLVLVQLAIWFTVPFALGDHIFGHVRYLTAAIAWIVAAGAARLERFRGLELLAGALMAQSLLMQGNHWSAGLRLAMGILLLAVGAWVLVPHPQKRKLKAPVVVVGLLAAILAAPVWVELRLGDRERAFREDWMFHDQPARFAAGAWGYLDREAGGRRVAAVTEPPNRFIVPAMGPRYERDVTYVNVQAPDIRFAPAYPNCVPPRTAPDRSAWLQNLVASEIHYLLVTVDPGRQPPIEATWAAESPELFVLRHRDPTSAVWELAGPLAEAVAAQAEAER